MAKAVLIMTASTSKQNGPDGSFTHDTAMVWLLATKLMGHCKFMLQILPIIACSTPEPAMACAADKNGSICPTINQAAVKQSRFAVGNRGIPRACLQGGTLP